MGNLFGANWWTTLWGFITVAAGAITVKPEIIAFLPDSWEPTVSGIALFVSVIAGGVFSVGVKSRNVTGGSVQQTVHGAVAAEGSQPLVDHTVKASMDSGERVTVAQENAMRKL